MPFTPAHVAAALPLRGRWRLPFAALAAGTMSPDLLYYVPGSSAVTPGVHSVAGVLTWDLAFGLVMWVAWRVAAPALHDLAPAVIRDRWHLPSRWALAWWTAPLAVVIGAATHVAWDSFTHAGRFDATHIGVLAATYPSPAGPMAGFHYAQYASGVIGVGLLIWAGLRVPRRSTTPRPQPRLAAVTPFVIIGAALAAGVAQVIPLFSLMGIEQLSYTFVTAAIAAAAVATAILCALSAVLRLASGTAAATIPTD